MNSSNTNNMHESLWFNFMWKKPYKIDIQWHLFINEMQLKFSDLKFSEFPMIPTCVMPSPLVRAGHSNSFLMSSIWERWWDFTSDKFQRNCDFHLAHSHSLFSLNEWSCHVVSCAMEMPMWPGTTNRQPETKHYLQPHEWAWQWFSSTQDMK